MLLFFNKTVDDILWETELNEFQKKHQTRYKYLLIVFVKSSNI